MSKKEYTLNKNKQKRFTVHHGGESKRKNSHLVKNCPYFKFFWNVFFRIQTEYGDVLFKPPYLVQIWGNTDQKNSEYGYFSLVFLLLTLNIFHTLF